eukprot:CAMPEP_0205828404 /NCGR_PEP_ID=MMETSP0206-20130828/35018_1 /ASSEMBLY_ACC=CAM_ASM_000279 /TAXON_ID=36767 /ORGANISM="Euplotes focardii, Strain TN1" /LENGTH=126 /DNA_ID=CAMNT_0053130193 /DNA_START=188 /DNA_END=568 /DNA_ORIENTATION=+
MKNNEPKQESSNSKGFTNEKDENEETILHSTQEEGKYTCNINDQFNPNVSPTQKSSPIEKKTSSNGNLLQISSAFRRTRNPLKSIKGDLYASNSDDSSSLNSEDMEWRLGDYIDTGSIGAVYRALD